MPGGACKMSDISGGRHVMIADDHFLIPPFLYNRYVLLLDTEMLVKGVPRASWHSEHECW